MIWQGRIPGNIKKPMQNGPYNKKHKQKYARLTKKIRYKSDLDGAEKNQPEKKVVVGDKLA